ncbi:MAG: histidine phosphatase family protein [Gammaproteobacteria bacterium]
MNDTPRELLILRHGKSDWAEATDDFHRPLKDRGKRGAQKMGVWMQDNGFIPDHIVASPAVRAIETARKAAKTMGLTTGDVNTDPRIYGAGARLLREVLADTPPEARRVLLVGHNPGLEALLTWLVGDQAPYPDDGKLLPTATIARVKLSCPWDRLAARCARLRTIVRPKSLPEGFPYPGPGPMERERRSRPAYYYTQSSVIPYRVENGRVEILIIASSGGKHWVVPKGIHDPGLTAQESAAKEAWEEAGAEGRVHDKRLGHYRYEKWGAVCEVSVYPMAVTRTLPESQWEERHRGRRWVSAEEAAKQVKQKELRPMILSLAKKPAR